MYGRSCTVGSYAAGSRTHNDLRARVEKHWSEVLKKLSLPYSKDKEATLERKISHALRRLKEERLAQDARQRLAAAVVEVIGHEWRKEVSKLIEGAELKVRVLAVGLVNNSLPYIWPHYNTVNAHQHISVFPKMNVVHAFGSL